MKRLVLIDGHAILYRAYHAFPKTLRTRRGEMVNAVYGFTRMLLGVIESLKPDYLIVTFDLPQPNFRHKLYVAYQHKRPIMDRELADQIARINQVVKTFNIPIFTAPGFEADDVIGTLTKQAEKKGVRTVIITGDRDIMQLVGKKTRVYSPVRGFSQGELFDVEKVKRLLGVKPDQIVDYKALVGDSSDNYPGVPGVGPKTATQLLQTYQTLDNVYQNLEKIRPAVAKRLKEGREGAKVSKKLAKIVTDVPAKLNLAAARLHDYDEEQVKKLFEELQFKSLMRKLPGVKKNQESRIKNKELKQLKLV